MGPRGRCGRSRAARPEPAALERRQRRRSRGGRVEAAGERRGLGTDWSELGGGRRAKRGTRPLPLRGRGDLRRPRGLGQSSSSSRRRRWCAWPDVRGRDAPVRAGHVISRLPGTGIAQGLRAGKDGHSPSSPTAHASRTTSATTRARTRSTFAASASSRAWRISTTTTASPSARSSRPGAAARRRVRRSRARRLPRTRARPANG